MATGFRTIPSAIAQQAALAQLREIQNPNLALQRQIEQAIQLQQIQQQSPENQLALQLRQAQLNSALQQQAFQQQQQPLLLKQLEAQLLAAQNPDAALDRRLQEDALRGIISGSNPNIILEPQISPETAAMRATAESEGGIPTTAYPQADFRAIVPARAGMPAIGISPSTGEAAKAKIQSNKIELANARLRQQGIKGQYQADANGDLFFLENPTTPGGAPTTTKVENPEGGAFKPQPKSTKGAGGLTANQQSNLRLRGGRALVDINQYTNTETGVVDWNLYASEVGKAEGNTLHANNLIKNARDSVKTTLDEKNLQIYGNRMVQANTDFDKLTQTGFDPTSLGAEGLLGGWSPNLLKSDDRQQYEQAERNFINSTLRRESGAVITDDEFANARKQYFPQPGDGEPVLAQKAANRKLVADEFIRLGGQQKTATPAPAGKIKILAPDGKEGYWPSNKPVPKGFKLSP